MAYARQAIAAAEAVGDPDMVVKAYDTLVDALGVAGDAQGALDIALANLARCGPGVSPERTIAVYNAVTAAMTDVARYAEIPAYAERAVELARTTGLGGPRAGWIADRWVESLVLLGRWSEAEQLVSELADLLDHPSAEGELAGSWGGGTDPPGPPRRGPSADRTGPGRAGPGELVRRCRLVRSSRRHVRRRRGPLRRRRGARQRGDRP